MKPCKTVVRLYLAKLRLDAAHDAKAKQHLAAFERPRGIERPLVGLFNCTCDYADEFRKVEGERIGDASGVIAHEWEALVSSLRGLLAGPVGRFDPNLLDDLALGVLDAAGL